MYFFPRVLLQLQEGFIRLGEGIGLLARGGAYLCRGFHIEHPQQVGKAVVRHDGPLDPIVPHNLHTPITQQVLYAVQQALFALHHVGQVCLQQGGIQLKLRVDEHAQRHVNQLELLLGEPHTHVPFEQLTGKMHVVVAIGPIACQLLRGEVRIPLAQRVQHFRALLPDAHALRLCCQRVRLLMGEQCPRHPHNIQPGQRLDPIVPLEDGPVEHRVLAHHHGIGPVDALQHLAHFRLGYPHRRLVRDGNTDTNGFIPGVPDICLGCQLR